MKLTLNDIPTFAAKVPAFIANYPHGQEIVNDVLGMGSGDETVCILTPEELRGNSTVCGGGAESECFRGRVIDFLKHWRVEFVVVGVVGPEAVQDDDYEIGLIAGGAVPVPFAGAFVEDWRDWFPDGNQYLSEIVADGDVPSPAQVLSELISENNGSWRADDCVDGWSTYESE